MDQEEYLVSFEKVFDLAYPYYWYTLMHDTYGSMFVVVLLLGKIFSLLFTIFHQPHHHFLFFHMEIPS